MQPPNPMFFCLIYKSQWWLLPAIQYLTLLCYINIYLSLPFIQLTPLHVAVRDGNEQTLKFIVDNGAAIDIKDDSGVSETLILTSPAVLSEY